MALSRRNILTGLIAAPALLAAAPVVAKEATKTITVASVKATDFTNAWANCKPLTSFPRNI